MTMSLYHLSPVCLGLGIAPDLIVCRSEHELTSEVKQKISHFCHVPPEQVICIHDQSSIYRVPPALEDQGLVEFFIKRLHLQPPTPLPRRLLGKWRDLAERHDNVHKSVSIALVGKYTKLEDSYASVIKAMKHSALACSHKLVIRFIEAADLEHETKSNNPVKYHEAWQLLCGAE